MFNFFYVHVRIAKLAYVILMQLICQREILFIILGTCGEDPTDKCQFQSKRAWHDLDLQEGGHSQINYANGNLIHDFLTNSNNLFAISLTSCCLNVHGRNFDLVIDNSYLLTFVIVNHYHVLLLGKYACPWPSVLDLVKVKYINWIAIHDLLFNSESNASQYFGQF